jgi:L-rhamnose mutarotase
MRLHRDVWPDLLELFQVYHVRNFTVFYHSGYLFSYKEYTGSHYDEDMAKLGEEPLMKQWLALTDPCQMPLASRKPGEFWADTSEIFHMD